MGRNCDEKSPEKSGISTKKIEKKMDFKIMCDSDDKNAKNPGNIPELL